MNLQDLKAPFPPEDIEWRVSRAGKKNGKVWAKVLAYVTNRAIMDRLDDVCGPERWRNEFEKGPDGGVLCGISIMLEYEEPHKSAAWVTKWDGAENTNIDPVKGGLSGSMKRAAVQWGIGRYLYNLDEGWADVNDNGAHFGRLPKDKGGDSFHWDPPKLPTWALPEGSATENPTPKRKTKKQRIQEAESGEGNEDLRRMGEKLNEMGESGCHVDEMHLEIKEFLEDQAEWTEGKKDAAKDWLYTRVTKIDSNR